MPCQLANSFQEAAVQRAPFQLLYQAEQKEPTASIVVSPVSFLISLATMYPASGLSSVTREELTEYLSDASKTQIEIGQHYGTLVHQLVATSGVHLSNGLFLDKSFAPRRYTIQVMQRAFLASVAQLDFTGRPEEATTKINRLIANQTDNKIPNLLDAGTIDSNTKMMLINTLSFNAEWKTKFDSSDTKIRPFHPASSSPQQVPMLRNTDEFLFNDNDNEMSVLGMRYANTKSTMYIVLPKAKTSTKRSPLSNVLHRLKTGCKCLWKLIADCSPVEVRVTLPKFYVEQELDLADKLPSLRLSSLADHNTNFSLLDDNDSLHVTSFLQKAVINVTEDGTEAVAATTTGFGYKIGSTPAEFLADRPFAYFIVTNITSLGPQVLFAGVVKDLKKNNNNRTKK